MTFDPYYKGVVSISKCSLNAKLSKQDIFAQRHGQQLLIIHVVVMFIY